MEASRYCRFCGYSLNKTFINLGVTPFSNSYLTSSLLNQGEIFYPLHAKICDQCLLVRLPQYKSPKGIFEDYAYFSSCSESWLKHSSSYVDMMIKRFSIDSNWQVIELASNDGYLLQFFKEANIPILGIEPAKNIAKIAHEKGIPTQAVFFGKSVAEKMAQDGQYADLLIANNVLAHVPNLNNFVAGMKIILAREGVLTIEFPHLLRLIEENQFDTIYHEHFSYFSLLVAVNIFSQHGLTIFDVEELPTHGGSLRIFVKHECDQSKCNTQRVEKVLVDEKAYGLDKMETYGRFSANVLKLKYDLLNFMMAAKIAGKKILGYGAPAKGNTLLNYFGIGVDFIPFTVDKSAYKQGRYLPGTHIPILSPDFIQQEKPDYIFILPWNLKNEITEQMACIREWGGKFVVPIPKLTIY